MKFNPNYRNSMLLIGFEAEFEELDYNESEISKKYEPFLELFDEVSQRKKVTLEEIGFGADWYVILMEIYITMSFGKGVIEYYSTYKKFFGALFDKIETLISSDNPKIERINYNTAFSIVLGKLAKEDISIQKIEVSSVSVIPKFGGAYRIEADNENGYDSVDLGEMDFNIVLKINESVWVNSIVESNGALAYFKISKSLSMHDDFSSEYDEFFR